MSNPLFTAKSCCPDEAVPMNETIEAAAILDAGVIYTLPRPARHLDVAQHYMRATGRDNFHRVQQGFVTSTGRYVDRGEARSIALAAGQIGDAETFQPHALFSEDVW